VVEVKAVACELPATQNVPLSRFSVRELAREAVLRGLTPSLSSSTVQRWLAEDVLRPWRHQSWIFPRAADFELKAGRVLDLYHRLWEGVALQADEYVVSADEKTSLQPRARLHPTQPPGPGQPMRVEHEYERGGALAYLAAWDVHRAKLFGRCEPTTGIVPFGNLVEQVMTQEPYVSARRVFWILDNGSSHRGAASVERLQTAWPNLRVVHLPVHASWLNQIEIYFSIVQRKVITPSNFASLQTLAATILAFQTRYEQSAVPFAWKFTREKLAKLMANLSQPLPLPLARCA
jgi:hypothetical protein